MQEHRQLRASIYREVQTAVGRLPVLLEEIRAAVLDDLIEDDCASKACTAHLQTML